jgi:hypothetical protein
MPMKYLLHGLLILMVGFKGMETIAQTDAKPDNKELQTLYTQALNDFITDAQQRLKTEYDTLYIGKRKNDLPDDFPEIALPSKIGKTVILLISPEEGEIRQKAIRSRYYINMFGWTEKKKAEFLLYIFTNEFEHKYNYKLIYEREKKSERFALKRLIFNVPESEK